MWVSAEYGDMTIDNVLLVRLLSQVMERKAMEYKAFTIVHIFVSHLFIHLPIRFFFTAFT